jgi:DnaJ-class molecular chaperone
MSKHSLEQPTFCRRCVVVIYPEIPHECNPDICADCNGVGETFVGRVDKDWVGMLQCSKCEGTGRTRFRDV